MKAKFNVDLQQKQLLSLCDDDPSSDTLWDNLEPTILKTSADVLGNIEMKNWDWFYEKMTKRFRT